MNKRFEKREAQSKNVYFKRFIINKAPNKLKEQQQRKAKLQNTLLNKKMVEGMEGLIEASKLVQQDKNIDVDYIEKAIKKWSQPDFRPDKFRGGIDTKQDELRQDDLTIEQPQKKDMNKLDTQKKKKTETVTRTEWKDDLNSSRKSLEPEKPTEE